MPAGSAESAALQMDRASPRLKRLRSWAGRLSVSRPPSRSKIVSVDDRQLVPGALQVLTWRSVGRAPCLEGLRGRGDRPPTGLPKGTVSEIRIARNSFEQGGPVEHEGDRQDRIAGTVTPVHANDSRAVSERLTDFAKRGTDAPETLTADEIRQVCFALSLYLDEIG